MIDRVRAARRSPPVTVMVDLVILTVRESELSVLLIERGNEPYCGRSALPGGHVLENEPLEDAAHRELGEETGLDGRQLHLEQLRTYGAPERDPRGRVITVAYLALGPDMPLPTAGTDARAAHWVNVRSIVDGTTALAFDHAVILADAVERARSQLEYTTVAAAFCREPFTLSELRHVYEVVWGFRLDPSNFRRKVLNAKEFVESIDRRTRPEVGRPAALYRRGSSRVLFPPLLRSGDAGPPSGRTPPG